MYCNVIDMFVKINSAKKPNNMYVKNIAYKMSSNLPPVLHFYINIHKTVRI